MLRESVARSGLPWLELREHSDLVRVRGILLSAAMDRGVEVVILVDSDNIPMGDAICALAAQATPNQAAFGIYRLRDGSRLSVEVSDPASAERAIAAGKPFPIIYGGLGLAAIHRQSLLRVAENLPLVRSDSVQWRPFCLPFVRDGVYYGDDRSLCARLTETGTDIIADPKIDVRHAVTALLMVPSVSATANVPP